MASSPRTGQSDTGCEKLSQSRLVNFMINSEEHRMPDELLTSLGASATGNE